MARTNNAGFGSPIEYWGQTANTKIALLSSSDGQAQQTLEGTDEHGDIAARDVFGDTLAPSGKYAVVADMDEDDLPSIGTLSAVTTIIGGASASVKLKIETITIETAAGEESTVTIAGKSVESGATQGRTFDLPKMTLAAKFAAQDVFGLLTLSGANCKITKCTSVVSATVGTGTKNGSPISSDVFGGKIVATFTVMQYGSATPSVTAAAGVDITKELAQTRQDSQYAEWQCEATLTVAATEPSP